MAKSMTKSNEMTVQGAIRAKIAEKYDVPIALFDNVEIPEDLSSNKTIKLFLGEGLGDTPFRVTYDDYHLKLRCTVKVSTSQDVVLPCVRLLKKATAILYNRVNTHSRMYDHTKFDVRVNVVPCAHEDCVISAKSKKQPKDDDGRRIAANDRIWPELILLALLCVDQAEHYNEHKPREVAA